jgi:hypothetical protein
MSRHARKQFACRQRLRDKVIAPPIDVTKDVVWALRKAEKKTGRGAGPVFRTAQRAERPAERFLLIGEKFKKPKFSRQN